LTRKSRPIRTRMNPIVWLLALGMLPVVGCSTFSPGWRSDKDYNDARKSINGGQYGNGVYRPEGVTAENKSSFLMLDRLGLSRKRRKDIDAARLAYSEGEKEFERAKGLQAAERRDAFRTAAKKFKKSADNWKSSQLAQDALMMQAESLFFAEDFYKAEQTYAALVKEYPRNPYLDQIDSRRFEIGDYWLKYHAAKPQSFAMVNFTDNKRPWNDTHGHGKRALENVRTDNPIGKLSDDATMRLAINYYEKQDWEMAAATFAELRQVYPDSEHQFNAQFLELQSLLAAYMGPEYSDLHLIEADKRAKAIVRLFPKEAQAKQLELRESIATIKYLMAEREWSSAQYRLLQGENLAAKMYLEQLIEKYPDTQFAEVARTRLGELEGKPDRPAQRFAPLVKLFRADNDNRTWTRPVFDDK
jgi:outer membrane protein assembly factor BamD (BamD/ComL family)